MAKADERGWETFLEQGPSVLIVDEEGRISHYGALVKERIGAREGSSKGYGTALTERLVPATALGKAVQACLASGRAIPFEAVLGKEGGEQLPLVGLAFPWSGEGAPRLAVVLLQPRSLQELPVQCSDSSTETVSATTLSRAIAEMAHELSRPLAAVLNFAELALADRQLSETTRTRLEMVLRQAEACREVVRGMGESLLGKGAPEELVDVNLAIRQAAESLDYVFEERGIALQLQLADDLPSVRGVAYDLQVALRNLLENAIEAAAAAEAPRVEVVSEQTENGLRVRVWDNGPGISPEVATQLFEPFVTTKSEGKGKGLGLAIVQRIVANHQGRIEAKSPARGGTELVLELPAAPATEKPQRGHRTPLTGGEKRPRALVIDDDAAMRMVLTTYLETLGYESREASNGEDGLQAALAEEYDIIVCDLSMPTMSGMEFYHQLKAVSPAQVGRVIFSTGVLLTEAARRLLRELPNPTLQKPYRLASLQAALAQVQGSGPATRS
ncbi:MAG: hybrid sensor histidine kinase/response regulator [Candidatus Zipacnadales bacterium]